MDKFFYLAMIDNLILYTFLPKKNSPTSAMFAAFIFLSSLLWISIRILRNKAGQKAPPEAGGGWPIIGHLHLLTGPKPPHIVLADLADKYGPIFTIRMGVRRALVVSDSMIAKECFTTNDKAFATRPKSLASEILAYDGAMLAFSPYGPYWRQNRKLVNLELLSSHRVEMFKDSREAEVRDFAKELYKFWEVNRKGSDKVLVEMKKWFGDITLNIIVKIVFGKTVGYMTAENSEDSAEWKEALRVFFDLSGTFVVADSLPFLRWLDIGGHEKTMKKTAKRLDQVVEEWLKEHKEKRASGAASGNGDFMDLMLNILDGNEDAATDGRDSDTVNKATCLALLLATSDTTMVTLSWILLLLINHPHVLRKVQAELDNHIGNERKVTESDLKNLVYLRAVIMETLRLYPAGPLSVPHESTEDVIISGYKVQSGTQLLLNLWKLHRDPRVWSKPEEFEPERFLTNHKEMDVKGQNFELIPFGSGRRMCPGISLALQSLQLIMATLLHGFDFTSPSGEPLDVTESIGLTNPPATPLQVYITPRISSHVYAP